MRLSEPDASTQIAHPARAATRTGLAAWVAGLIVLVGVLPELVRLVEDEIGGLLPERYRLWLAGVATAAAAIAALVNRIMLIPAVNEALRKIGIGPRP